ncbi:hypothetical protein ACYZTX_16160 [Pseudomonas sp. MDT1-17]
MFGTRLTEITPIKEAIATYMMRATDKLRAQQSRGLQYPGSEIR